MLLGSGLIVKFYGIGVLMRCCFHIVGPKKLLKLRRKLVGEPSMTFIVFKN